MKTYLVTSDTYKDSNRNPAEEEQIISTTNTFIKQHIDDIIADNTVYNYSNSSVKDFAEEHDIEYSEDLIQHLRNKIYGDLRCASSQKLPIDIFQGYIHQAILDYVDK